MTGETQQAYDWSINTPFQSVAARYARLLAAEVKRLHGENHTLREAVAAAVEEWNSDGWDAQFCDEPMGSRMFDLRIAAGIKAPPDVTCRDCGAFLSCQDVGKGFTECFESPPPADDPDGDVGPCMGCGEPVHCVPDGLPLCDVCAEKPEYGGEDNGDPDPDGDRRPEHDR